jgi:probable HAF family extracellular repeat protein
VCHPGQVVRHAFIVGASHAYGVNDRREVVGMSETAWGETHVFLWRDGVMIDLGAYVDGRDSVAAAINNRGQVLGIRFDGSRTPPVM